MRDMGNCGAILRDLASGIEATARQERLTAVVECLTDVLSVQSAIVGELLADGGLQVLAYSTRVGGSFPLGTRLPGAIWAAIAERGSYSCPDGFGRTLLAGTDLETLGVEGFQSRTLRDGSGSPVGLLGVLDRFPLGWGPGADALLTVLALPVEIELNRRRSQLAVCRAASQWAAIVDTMPEFVAVIGPDHRFQRVNLALARFASVHPRELVGRRCHEVVHGLAAPWPGCPHAAAMRTGRGATAEVNVPRLGQPMSVSCTPLFSDCGDVLGTVHIARPLSREASCADERRAAAAPEARAGQTSLLGRHLPMCAGCRKVRDDDGRWQEVDVFLRDQAGAAVTHGICPECTRLLYPGLRCE